MAAVLYDGYNNQNFYGYGGGYTSPQRQRYNQYQQQYTPTLQSYGQPQYAQQQQMHHLYGASPYANGTLKPTSPTAAAAGAAVAVPAMAAPIGSTPHQVYPDYTCVLRDKLFLGNAATASKPELLQSLGITHVLNMAQEMPSHEGDPNYPFVYKHLHLVDDESEDCSPYLPHAFYFIDEAIQNNGRVYVHCHMGVSRGPTAVIYYIMIKKDWSFEKALTSLRKKRPQVNPNFGYACSLLHFVYTGASPSQNQPIRVPLGVVIDEMLFVSRAYFGGVPRSTVETTLKENGMHIEQSLRQLRARAGLGGAPANVWAQPHQHHQPNNYPYNQAYGAPQGAPTSPVGAPRQRRSFSFPFFNRR